MESPATKEGPFYDMPGGVRSFSGIAGIGTLPQRVRKNSLQRLE